MALSDALEDGAGVRWDPEEDEGGADDDEEEEPTRTRGCIFSVRESPLPRIGTEPNIISPRSWADGPRYARTFAEEDVDDDDDEGCWG
jgi:hypothetical protein